MKADYVWITKYKSINHRSKLVIDPSVTAVIGKNESGKSNLIDIVGAISLVTGIPDDFFTKTTQGQESGKLIVEVECSFSADEMEAFGTNRSSMFTISQDKPYNIDISGGVSEYFSSYNYQELVGNLRTIIENHQSKMSNSTSINNIKTWFGYLENAAFHIIARYSNHLNNIKAQIVPIISNSEKEELNYLCEEIRLYFSNMYERFPIFYKYKEKSLSNHYQISKEFLEKDSPELQSLTKLLIAANCNLQDLQDACLDHPHTGRGMDAKRKIERGIRERIEEGFNKFYKQEEHVEFIIDLKPNRVSFFVNSSGTSIPFSERSNGLKWYLNMYIDLLSNDLHNKQVVYLIDEPGTFLHVDAQKRVLELFNDLAKSNQVIYTTHSPYMINENRIDRIRAMQINDNGHSEIITSVLSEKIISSSKSETLSPLVSALGMKLYQNLGMSNNKINVITEGFSDAIYLDAMAKKLNVLNLKFVPSVGASNVVYLANILWGWGFPFKVLFDWDKGGRDGKKILIKAYASNVDSQEAIEYKKQHVVMISEVFTDSPNLNDNYTIESLIDSEDYDNVGLNYSSDIISKNGNLKSLYAKRFAETVSQESIRLSEKTIANFRSIFKKLSV